VWAPGCPNPPTAVLLTGRAVRCIDHFSTSEIEENATFVSTAMEMKRKGTDLDMIKRNTEIMALRQVQKATCDRDAALLSWPLRPFV
jgi:hypothetical protein